MLPRAAADQGLSARLLGQRELLEQRLGLRE
jgi:hypothetical protein